MAATSSEADLVVYGGTASGVVTAYTAAKEGLHVILLEPGSHLGGMVTGGPISKNSGCPFFLHISSTELAPAEDDSSDTRAEVSRD